MADRMELQKKLCSILGSNNVYFEPPENIKINYPCFIYSIESPYTTGANNKLYSYMNSYSVTYINRDPHIEIIEKMLSSFTYATTGSSYVSDGLHHYTFDIFF